MSLSEEIKQKANTFMIKESNAHEDNWKGYTTEEWMSLFAQELVEEQNRQIKDLELMLDKCIQRCNELDMLEGRLEEANRTIESLPNPIEFAELKNNLEQIKKLLKSWIDFREGVTGDCPEMEELLDAISEKLGLVGLEEGKSEEEQQKC